MAFDMVSDVPMCCLWETHHTLLPFNMVSDVPIRSYKSVADAYWGFHQVELDDEIHKLTTFITPWALSMLPEPHGSLCCSGHVHQAL